MNISNPQFGVAPILIIFLLSALGVLSFVVVNRITPQTNPQSPQVSLLPTPSPEVSSSGKVSTTTKGSLKPSPSPSSKASIKSSSSPITTSQNSTSSSDKTTVKLTVKDQYGNSLPNAAVEFTCSCGKLRNGDKQDEQVDGSGNLTLTNLPLGVSISAKAFYSSFGPAQNFTLSSNQTLNLNLIVNTASTTNNSSPNTTNSTTPYVKVISPNGGESLSKGQSHTITWEAPSSVNWSRFVITYESSGGGGGNIVTAGGSDRSYNWTVSVGNTTNTQFKISIVGYTSAVENYVTPTDNSNNYFTVN